jgi:hypothetical protein
LRDDRAQFDKLEGEGYAKLKRARAALNGQKAKGKFMERMDLWVLGVVFQASERVRALARRARY